MGAQYNRKGVLWRIERPYVGTRNRDAAKQGDRDATKQLTGAQGTS